MKQRYIHQKQSCLIIAKKQTWLSVVPLPLIVGDTSHSISHYLCVLVGFSCWLWAHQIPPWHIWNSNSQYMIIKSPCLLVESPFFSHKINTCAAEISSFASGIAIFSTCFPFFEAEIVIFSMFFLQPKSSFCPLFLGGPREERQLQPDARHPPASGAAALVVRLGLRGDPLQRGAAVMGLDDVFWLLDLRI